LFKKILIIGILFLFLGTCSTPSTAIDNVRKASFPISDKTLIIVDDEGDGDYTTIKDAVNHTSPGDVIEVYSGKYVEEEILIEIPRVTIKGIPYEFLNGTDSGTPLVVRKDKGYVFFICSEEVIVTNLKIDDGPGNQSCCAFIYLYYAKKSIIADNKLRNSMVGIKCSHSDHAKIINNTIELTEYAISLWYESNEVEISENHITHSKTGISLNRVDSNKIIRNWVTQCQTSIIVDDSNHNYICCNNLEKNNKAILLWESKNNIIQQNHIVNNYYTVHLYYSNSNYLCCNNIENNSIEMVLSRSGNNTIQQNNFINNSDTVNFFNTKYIISQKWSTVLNKWNANYWDDWTGNGPKMLRGRLLFNIHGPFWSPYPRKILEITFLQFDWHPAKEPFNIDV